MRPYTHAVYLFIDLLVIDTRIIYGWWAARRARMHLNWVTKIGKQRAAILS